MIDGNKYPTLSRSHVKNILQQIVDTYDFSASYCRKDSQHPTFPIRCSDEKQERLPLKRLDIRRLISDLGGAESIVVGLRTTGVEDISVKGVEKWRERGSIPMDRWIQLVEMERKNNRRSLVLDDYYLRGDKGAKPSRAA